MITVQTHSGRAHIDEMLGVGFFLQDSETPDQIRIVRSREDVGADIQVDVGGRYSPKDGRFDHHGRHLPDECAYVLVARHLFGDAFVEQAQKVHPWWSMLDRIDREGLHSVMGESKPHLLSAALQSPIGSAMRTRFAEMEVILPHDPMHGFLENVATTVVQQARRVDEKARRILKDGEIFRGEGVRVLITPETAEKDAFGLARQQEGFDVTVAPKDGKVHVYRYGNMADTLDLSVLADEPGCTFAHEQGFLAVFTSYEDARMALERLLKRAGLVGEAQIIPLYNADFDVAETIEEVLEPFDSTK